MSPERRPEHVLAMPVSGHDVVVYSSSAPPGAPCWRPDDVDAMVEAMASADLDRLDPAAIVANAERFSVERFQARIRAEVERAAVAAA